MNNELIRSNLRRIRTNYRDIFPGIPDDADVWDRFGNLSYEAIADAYDVFTNEPVKVSTLRTVWFGTTDPPTKYRWTQLVGLARAMGVSILDLVLPSDDVPQPQHAALMEEAAAAFGMQPGVLENRRTLALHYVKEEFLHEAVWVAPAVLEARAAASDALRSSGDVSPEQARWLATTAIALPDKMMREAGLRLRKDPNRSKTLNSVASRWVSGGAEVATLWDEEHRETAHQILREFGLLNREEA